MKETRFTALAGSERVPVPGARAVGAADAESWLEVTLKLVRRKPLPEPDARLRQAATRAELAASFGADPAQLERVAQTFAAFGLTVVATDAATRTVRLGGPVGVMEEAFQVRLMRFTHAHGDYRGRVGALHVPSSVADVVEGVFGLDDRRVAHRRPSRQRKSLSDTAHATHAAHRPWFFPAELAAAYDFPEGDGQGQTIGLIEFGGGFFADDLTAFARKAGLADIPTVVPISVGHMPTDTRDDAVGEVMLDVEVIAGVCPRATLPVWFAPFTEKGWVDVLDAALHDAAHQPQVLSISWGYAEDADIWTAAAVKQVNEALKEAALLGITVCVAAGDDGSSDGVTDGHAHVDFPAASPYVLAVGGTLLRTGTRRSERVWKDGDGLRSDGGGSTGGGVSARIARPAWQGGLDIATVNPGQIAGRITPDVAANASAHTGYFVVAAGQAVISGGTSASAPLWAALVARMNQSLAATGQRVGFLTPLLYGPAGPGQATLGALGCHDIPSGDNNTAHVGGFSARVGYDAVTGWGSPKGKDLLAALAKVL